MASKKVRPINPNFHRHMWKEIQRASVTWPEQGPVGVVALHECEICGQRALGVITTYQVVKVKIERVVRKGGVDEKE
jgi:hypothetical protein